MKIADRQHAPMTLTENNLYEVRSVEVLSNNPEPVWLHGCQIKGVLL